VEYPTSFHWGMKCCGIFHIILLGEGNSHEGY
jgi:hypothetical protein